LNGMQNITVPAPSSSKAPASNKAPAAPSKQQKALHSL
jgi:hypothetical protein